MKLSVRVGVLCLCSYITLPLYTLMGSGIKKSNFDEQTTKALKKWRLAARRKHAKAGKPPTRITLGGSVSSASPAHGHTFHRSYSIGRSSYTYKHNMSDLEAEPLSRMSRSNLIKRADWGEKEIGTSENHIEEKEEDDFSFFKPTPLKQVP